MVMDPRLNSDDGKIEEMLLVDPNESEEFEKFNAPPPGHSLTDEPGKWPWENPPQFTDPKEAYDFIISKAEEPVNEENFVRLLLSGATVEAITNTITFGGFTGGFFSVDVAELLKTPIALHFIGLAAENNIPAQVFNTNPEQEKEDRLIPDEEVLDNMKRNRPDMFEALENAAENLLETEPQDLPEEKSMMNEESMMNMEDEEEKVADGFMSMEEEGIEQ